MSDHTRFAVYYVPEDGPLAAFGAKWLGWDVARAVAVTQPGVPGIVELTNAPRKYGFHGTMKPPFRLAEGYRPGDLEDAVHALASRTAPARAASLELSQLGHFFALTPTGDASGIERVAGACVTELDEFRAPLTDADLKRRRASGLTDRQDTLLRKWGYPYVLTEFRFHLTLTGRVANEHLATVNQEIAPRLPALPAPFFLDQIALLGERRDGRFELLHRYALTG